MSLILSFILCFALAFSGPAGLPAEPETATTWTIRNVTLSDGDETITLNPEARITAAIGTEKAALHFEIADDGKVYLPISAEITPEELTFALSASNHAYSMTNAEFLKITDMDEEDIRLLNILSDLVTSYGALLGMSYGDEEQMTAYSQTVLETMISTCGSEFAPVEIEFAGETLEAQRAEFALTDESTFALLDALRTCGIEELETFLNSLLAIVNLEEDEAYPDFTTLAESLRGNDIENFNLPMAITYAEADGFSYGLVESQIDVEEAEMSMGLREEIVSQGEETNVIMMMIADTPEATFDYNITAQITGPLNAPEEMHLDYYISALQSVLVEDGDGDYETETAMHMTLDCVQTDGLYDANAEFTVNTAFDGDISSDMNMRVNAVQRSEDDGSVTTDVAFELLIDEIEAYISFEINRSESAYADFFDGAELFELTEDTFNSDSDEMSPAAATLISDAALLSADAMQLATDESIQALSGLGGDIDPINPVDDEVQTVSSLEEAAEVFEGTLPAYTPPEGFALTSIDADSNYVDIEYESEDSGFEMSIYNYSSTTSTYALSDSKLFEIDRCVVLLRQYGDDYISSADVILPDGTTAYVYFYGTPTLDEVETILSGFGQ